MLADSKYRCLHGSFPASFSEWYFPSSLACREVSSPQVEAAGEELRAEVRQVEAKQAEVQALYGVLADSRLQQRWREACRQGEANGEAGIC